MSLRVKNYDYGQSDLCTLDKFRVKDFPFSMNIT